LGSGGLGAPGIAANARAVAKLDIDEADLPGVLAGHARKVYRGLDPPEVD
jgi:hypothetical protein